MTIQQLASAMRRRWYVVAVALVVAAIGGYLLERQSGMYASQTVVAFTLPDKTTLSPYSGLDNASVIAFAGLVVRAVNKGQTPQGYSTDEAPYYGAGIREGVLVSLPHLGNQWVTSYLRAEIVLEIVGPTEQWVAEKQRNLLTKVDRIATAQQGSVAPGDVRIRATPMPSTERILPIAPSGGLVVAAFSALFVAALIVGGWGAVLVDDRVRNSRSVRRMPRRIPKKGPEQ